MISQVYMKYWWNFCRTRFYFEGGAFCSDVIGFLMTFSNSLFCEEIQGLYVFASNSCFNCDRKLLKMWLLPEAMWCWIIQNKNKVQHVSTWHMQQKKASLPTSQCPGIRKRMKTEDILFAWHLEILGPNLEMFPLDAHRCNSDFVRIPTWARSSLEFPRLPSSTLHFYALFFFLDMKYPFTGDHILTWSLGSWFMRKQTFFFFLGGGVALTGPQLHQKYKLLWPSAYQIRKNQPPTPNIRYGGIKLEDIPTQTFVYGGKPISVGFFRDPQ